MYLSRVHASWLNKIVTLKGKVIITSPATYPYWSYVNGAGDGSSARQQDCFPQILMKIGWRILNTQNSLCIYTRSEL